MAVRQADCRSSRLSVRTNFRQDSRPSRWFSVKPSVRQERRLSVKPTFRQDSRPSRRFSVKPSVQQEGCSSRHVPDKTAVHQDVFASRPKYVQTTVRQEGCHSMRLSVKPAGRQYGCPLRRFSDNQPSKWMPVNTSVRHDGCQPTGCPSTRLSVTMEVRQDDFSSRQLFITTAFRPDSCRSRWKSSVKPDFRQNNYPSTRLPVKTMFVKTSVRQAGRPSRRLFVKTAIRQAGCSSRRVSVMGERVPSYNVNDAEGVTKHTDLPSTTTKNHA